MELIITDKLIIQDAEDVSSRLSHLSGQACDLEKMKEFILNEKATIFYFDNKMNGKAENDNGILYAWLDSGYVTKNGNKPLFISLLKSSDGYFTGHYVGTAKTLSSSIIDYYPQNTRSINSNLSRFPLKYDKKINKRTTKHLPLIESEADTTTISGDNSVREISFIGKQLENAGMVVSEETNDVKIKTEEKSVVIPKVMTEITEEIYDQLLFHCFRTLDGLDRYLKIIEDATLATAC